MTHLEYQQPRLSSVWDIPPILRRLNSGIKPDSLKPNGTFGTLDGSLLWSRHLLGLRARHHFLKVVGPEVLAVWEIGTSNKIDEIGPKQLRLVQSVEHLHVGKLGYLLYPDETDQRESVINSLPEIDPLNPMSLSIKIQVDPSRYKKWVDLLIFGMYSGQKEIGEDDFIVVSGQYQILPRSLKFVHHEYPYFGIT